MTDPCKDKTLLSAYLDGELPESQAAEVERHLETCGTCRHEYDTLRRIDTTVQHMEAMAPSADFDRTFWAKVDALEQQSRSRSWIQYLFSGWRPLLAGGLAGLVAAVIILSPENQALNPEEVFIAENMEMLENFELIGDLEMLEHWVAMEPTEEPS